MMLVVLWVFRIECGKLFVCLGYVLTYATFSR